MRVCVHPWDALTLCVARLIKFLLAPGDDDDDDDDDITAYISMSTCISRCERA